MKRIICALLALTVIVAAAWMTASAADKPDTLLLLGDSITYGYGLEGGRDTCASYGNLLRDYLGISAGNCKNAAVNGATSEDLLAQLPSLIQNIKNADLIVITIGGNDLLGLIWEAGKAVLGDAFSSYGNILDILADPAKSVQLAEQMTTEKISAAVAKYTTNISGIMSYIRSNNPNAEVLLLAQYDPMSGVEGLAPLSTISNTAINMINTAMKAQETAGLCKYVDVYTPFVGHGADWTNILMADIHPNFFGHEMIFNIVKENLSYVPEETTVEVPETTVPVVPDTTTSGEVVTSPEPTTPDQTTAPDGDETTASTGDVPSAVTTVPDIAEPDQQGGCGGSLAAMSVLAAVALGAAVVARKEK